MALVLLEVAINPTTEPVDSRTGSPWEKTNKQTNKKKKLTVRERRLTHQQTIGLKTYREWLCPPEKDLFSPQQVHLLPGSLHKPLTLIIRGKKKKQEL